MSDRNAEIIRLAALGKRNIEIATALGLTRGTVAGVMNRAGLKSPRQHSTVATTQARFLERKRRGQGVVEDNGPTFGISRATGFQASAVGGAGCRFPLWRHEDRPDGRFCGKPALAPGEPYCSKHHALTHQKASVAGLGIVGT